MSTQLTAAEMECGIIFKHEFTVFDAEGRETSGDLVVVRRDFDSTKSEWEFPLLIDIRAQTPLSPGLMEILIEHFRPNNIRLSDQPPKHEGPDPKHPTRRIYKARFLIPWWKWKSSYPPIVG